MYSLEIYGAARMYSLEILVPHGCTHLRYLVHGKLYSLKIPGTQMYSLEIPGTQMYSLWK